MPGSDLLYFSNQTRDPLAFVTSVHVYVWAYVIGSVLLLLAVRSLRRYPLYMLKSAWIGFTCLAFAWVILMSGATNKEFAMRPAGVFGQIARYPEAFRACFFGLDAWWIPLLSWLPLWAVGGLYDSGTRLRLSLRMALGLVTFLLGVPLLWLIHAFDWSAYGHFFDNYTQAWTVARMGDYFFNSILVSVCAVGLVAVLGSLAAYSLTRLRFFGRKSIMSMLIASMAMPGFLLVVPLFVMMKDWSIGNFSFMDSRTGLAVLYAAMSLPFTIFLLSAFYQSLPTELAESAALDGAEPWRIFAEIYFPLSMPGLATASIFNFLGVWNEYNFALIFVTNPELKTLPVGLYNLQVSQQYAVNWPALFAGVVILCVPTFLIFVILQERIVAGLTVGAVKG